MTPWLPPDYDEYPSVRIDKTPSLQVEFLKTDNHSFEEGDCRIYGSNSTLIAAKFCLSEADSKSLHAGKFKQTYMESLKQWSYIARAIKADGSSRNIRVQARA